VDYVALYNNNQITIRGPNRNRGPKLILKWLLGKGVAYRESGEAQRAFGYRLVIVGRVGLQ
jgi:hypothetical protein